MNAPADGCEVVGSLSDRAQPLVEAEGFDIDPVAKDLVAEVHVERHHRRRWDRHGAPPAGRRSNRRRWRWCRGRVDVGPRSPSDSSPPARWRAALRSLRREEQRVEGLPAVVYLDLHVGIASRSLSTTPATSSSSSASPTRTVTTSRPSSIRWAATISTTSLQTRRPDATTFSSTKPMKSPRRSRRRRPWSRAPRA